MAKEIAKKSKFVQCLTKKEQWWVRYIYNLKYTKR